MQPSVRAAVVAEVQMVTAAMSRNKRWSQQDLHNNLDFETAELWRGFDRLRSVRLSPHPLSGVPCRSRLSLEESIAKPLDPFLAVLTSPQASGVVTGVSISSVAR